MHHKSRVDKSSKGGKSYEDCLLHRTPPGSNRDGSGSQQTTVFEFPHWFHFSLYEGRTVKTVTGNLIQLAQQGRFDVIIHGCNCMHTMGAGIALQIKRTFPDAYNADLQTPLGASKLGTISFAQIPMTSLCVVNGYTQVHWKGRGV